MEQQLSTVINEDAEENWAKVGALSPVEPYKGQVTNLMSPLSLQ